MQCSRGLNQLVELSPITSTKRFIVRCTRSWVSTRLATKRGTSEFRGHCIQRRCQQQRLLGLAAELCSSAGCPGSVKDGLEEVDYRRAQHHGDHDARCPEECASYHHKQIT